MLKTLPANQVLLLDLDLQSGARIQKQIMVMKSRKMATPPETEIMATMLNKLKILVKTKLRCRLIRSRKNISINKDPDRDQDHMTIEIITEIVTKAKK